MKEIEYKFLVFKKKLPKLEKGLKIIQGYISSSPTVRVRLVSTEEYKKAFITIKGNGTLIRDEFEYEIPFEDGLQLIVLCNKKLSKTRYLIPAENGLKWEIDVFEKHLEGLIIAELEVPSIDYKFTHPEWIKEDVTSDKKYTNSNLAL
jgi:adenylate cyclase